MRRRAGWFGVVMLSLLGLSGCASGGADPAPEAQACPRGGAPVYAVKTLLPAPRIDNTLSLDQIAVRSDRGYRYLTLGDTESEFLVVGYAKSRTVPSAAGGDCAYPTKVSLMLALGKRVIHIAREFGANEPCVHREVLGHERRHVALDNAILTEEKASLPRTLPRLFADLDGVWGKDDAAARQNLRKRLDADDDGLHASIEAKRRAAQAADVDTVAEQHRLLRVCGGRLHQLYPEYY